MNKIIYDILDNVNEGIIILDEDLKILYWNSNMECLTHISEKNAVNNSIYDAVPGLNKDYFHKAIKNALNDGRKMFFSAAMHKNLLSNNINLNLKISRIKQDNSNFILVEFIDMTNQFLRIKQLKQYVNKLYVLNKELKEKEKIINKLAFYDGLTGLANRRLFYKIAEKFCINAKRNNDYLGLMFIDTDKFKSINDTYGHKKGDDVLIHVARILEDSIRKGDIPARFGGDEFLVLLPFVNSCQDCMDVASRIINATKNLCLEKEQVDLSLSIGISIMPNDGDNIDQLILKADKAMYEVKHQGGNGYRSFS